MGTDRHRDPACRRDWDRLRVSEGWWSWSGSTPWPAQGQILDSHSPRMAAEGGEIVEEEERESERERSGVNRDEAE